MALETAKRIGASLQAASMALLIRYVDPVVEIFTWSLVAA